MFSKQGRKTNDQFSFKKMIKAHCSFLLLIMIAKQKKKYIEIEQCHKSSLIFPLILFIFNCFGYFTGNHFNFASLFIQSSCVNVSCGFFPLTDRLLYLLVLSVTIAQKLSNFFLFYMHCIFKKQNVEKNAGRWREGI